MMEDIGYDLYQSPDLPCPLLYIDDDGEVGMVEGGEYISELDDILSEPDLLPPRRVNLPNYCPIAIGET